MRNNEKESVPKMRINNFFLILELNYFLFFLILFRNNSF